MADEVEAGGIGADDALKIAGGGVFFLGGLLSWWQMDLGGFGSHTTAFDHFLTGTLPWLIFGAVALLTLLDWTGSLRVRRSLLHPGVQLVVVAAAAAAVVYRFFNSEWADDGATEVSRGIGLYLALLGAVLTLAGCVLAVLWAGAEEAGDERRVVIDDITPQTIERPPLP